MPFAEAREAAVRSHGRSEGRRLLLQLTPFERHKQLLADHAKHYGAPSQPAVRVTTDEDVLRQAHRFLRSEQDDADGSWEARLAAKYYARLFKEFCIADLSRYKQHQLGLRWRTESEVMSGRGQFSCGAKGCRAADNLVSYEVPFAYAEAGEQKQALVKLRVCPDCAVKLTFGRNGAQPRASEEPARGHKRRRREAAGEQPPGGDAGEKAVEPREAERQSEDEEGAHWAAKAADADVERTRDGDMDEYLAALFA